MGFFADLVVHVGSLVAENLDIFAFLGDSDFEGSVLFAGVGFFRLFVVGALEVGLGHVVSWSDHFSESSHVVLLISEERENLLVEDVQIE